MKDENETPLPNATDESTFSQCQKGILRSASRSQENVHSAPITPTQLQSSPNKKSRLRWDEDNIIITGQDRGTRMKISEPKTPYVHYNAETDQIFGGLGSASGSGNIYLPPMDLNAALEKYDLSDLRYETSSNASGSSSSVNRRLCDWDTSEEELEQGDERKKDFAKKRMEHYNMSDALRMGKRLLGSSGNEEEEDDEDESDVEMPPVITRSPVLQHKGLADLVSEVRDCDQEANMPIIEVAQEPMMIDGENDDVHRIRQRSVSFSMSADIINEHLDVKVEEKEEEKAASSDELRRSRAESTSSLKSALLKKTSFPGPASPLPPAKSALVKRETSPEIKSEGESPSLREMLEGNDVSTSKKHVRIVDSRKKLTQEELLE